MPNRRHAALAFAFSFAAATGAAHALKVDGDAPQVEFKGISDPNFSSLKSQFETKMNVEVKTAFDNAMDTARKNLSIFGSQKKLAQGFANSNAYATNSGTLQGFQNYDLFAVSGGLMLSAQLPSFDISAISGVADDIQDKGDIYAGIGASVTFLNVGLNCKFLLPGLYLNAKYGAFKKSFNGADMDFSVMGVGANYKLLDTKSLAGIIKWRGVSVGSGFYMQSDKLNLGISPDPIKNPAHFREAVLSGATDASDSTQKEAILEEMGYGKNDSDATVTLKPTFNMGLDVSTYTVPFEVNTAVSLLFGLINLNAGLGMDLNFGDAKVVLKSKATADVSSDTTKVVFKPAKINIDGSSSSGPSFARLRAMTGVGLGLGPVKIDIPIIYYFNSGAAFGVTAAVVW